MLWSKKILLVLLILILCSPAVFAQSVSFAQPDVLTHQDVYMYFANGSLIGLYNTTSTGIVLPSASQGDVQFTFKPKNLNPLDDPAGTMAAIISYFESNAPTLLVAAGIFGLLFKRF